LYEVPKYREIIDNQIQVEFAGQASHYVQTIFFDCQNKNESIFKLTKQDIEKLKTISSFVGQDSAEKNYQLVRKKVVFEEVVISKVQCKLNHLSLSLKTSNQVSLVSLNFTNIVVIHEVNIEKTTTNAYINFKIDYLNQTLEVEEPLVEPFKIQIKKSQDKQSNSILIKNL